MTTEEGKKGSWRKSVRSFARCSSKKIRAKSCENVTLRRNLEEKRKKPSYIRKKSWSDIHAFAKLKTDNLLYQRINICKAHFK